MAESPLATNGSPRFGAFAMLAQTVTMLTSIGVLIMVARITFVAGQTTATIGSNTRTIQQNNENISRLSQSVADLAVALAQLTTASEERRAAIMREIDQLVIRIRELEKRQ